MNGLDLCITMYIFFQVVAGQLPLPHPPLTPFKHEEELREMKSKHPSFNTTQIRRSRYKKPGISKTRVGSSGVRSGRDRPAPISLKDVLAQPSLKNGGEVKSDEERVTDGVEVMATSSLPSLSHSQNAEEKPEIDEVSHIKETEEEEEEEEGEKIENNDEDELLENDDEDEILQYIRSLRRAIGKTIVIGRHRLTSQTESEEPMVTPSHIASVKDLKAFSRKPPRGRSAGLGSDEFKYAIAKSSGNWNPYELILVSGERVRCQEVYFTISAFNVSQVRGQTCEQVTIICTYTHFLIFMLPLK